MEIRAYLVVPHIAVAKSSCFSNASNIYFIMFSFLFIT